MPDSVQLGTASTCIAGERPDRCARVSYDAFWSTAALRYLPRELLHLSPGDLIQARITGRPGAWQLVLVDASRREQRRLTVPALPGAPHAEASWLEEVPITGAHRIAFPLLSRLSMSEVRVNGHAPDAARTYSMWMAERGRYLAPTALQSGRFTVIPRGISRVAMAYYHTVELSQSLLERALSRWPLTRRDLAVSLSPTMSTLHRNLSTEIVEVRALSLPPGQDARRRRLLTRLHQLIPAVSPPPQGASVQTWNRRFLRAVTGLGRADHALRAALGLPEIVPVGLYSGAG